MKYHIQIEDPGDFNMLADFQIQQAIESAANIVFAPGIAKLVIDNMKREKDRKMLIDLGQELFQAHQRLEEDKRLPIVITDVVRNHYNDIAPKFLNNAQRQTGVPYTPIRTMKQVPSDTRPGHVHTLTIEEGRAIMCTCESFHFNSEKGKNYCKHTTRENLRG